MSVPFDNCTLLGRTYWLTSSVYVTACARFFSMVGIHAACHFRLHMASPTRLLVVHTTNWWGQLKETDVRAPWPPK